MATPGFGTTEKVLSDIDAGFVGAHASVTITDSAYTVQNLKDIQDATNGAIVLQKAANPQLEGSVANLLLALDGIKYSGAITVSDAAHATLASVLVLTTGKVTAEVSGTATELVAALADENTVNALTLTVSSGTPTAAELKILDAKTSLTVDASSVTAIKGTAAELKTVLAATTITTAEDVDVEVTGTVTATDVNVIAKATEGTVTAEVEGSAAALNAA